jgi:hypothetical protein
MHIAYSALQPDNYQDMQQQTASNSPAVPDNESLLRYRAYQTTCSKYRREIAAIQQYLPGWAPSPPAI